MRRTKRVACWLLATTFGLSPLSAFAAQASAPFKVTVTLQTGNNPAPPPPAPPTSGFCQIGADPDTFGAIVTIVCATGVVVELGAPRGTVAWTPIHGGTYRFMNIGLDQVQRVQFTRLMEGYTGIGTVTSWRVVPSADRDYLEMLIGW